MGMGTATSLVKADFVVKGYDVNADAIQTFTEAKYKHINYAALEPMMDKTCSGI